MHWNKRMHYWKSISRWCPRPSQRQREIIIWFDARSRSIKFLNWILMPFWWSLFAWVASLLKQTNEMDIVQCCIKHASSCPLTWRSRSRLSASIPKWGLINGRQRERKGGKGEINKAGSRGKNRWTWCNIFRGVWGRWINERLKYTCTPCRAYRSFVVWFYVAMNSNKSTF